MLSLPIVPAATVGVQLVICGTITMHVMHFVVFFLRRLGLPAQETPEVPKADEKVAEEKPKEETVAKESEKAKDAEKAKEDKPADGEKGKDADKSKEKEKPKEKKKKQYKVDEELLLAFRFIDKNGEHFICMYLSSMSSAVRKRA